MTTLTQGVIKVNVGKVNVPKTPSGKFSEEVHFTPKAPSFFGNDEELRAQYYRDVASIQGSGTDSNVKPSDEKKGNPALDALVITGATALGIGLIVTGQPLLGALLMFGGIFLRSDLLRDD